MDAAHLIVWPRPGAYGAAVCVLCALLHAGYAAPGNRLGAVLRAFVPRGIAGRALGVCGLTASTPAGAMAAEQWYRLALALGRTPSVRWPSLPKRLTGRQLVRLRE